MIVILLGPPGVGKGTQGVLLAEHLGWVHVATGDLLRGHRRRGTQLGREAQAFMDGGELVPDEVIEAMVEDVVNAMEDGQGVVFDGYPRTVTQAEGLAELMAREGLELRALVLLGASDETIVRRLGGRRSCPACSAIYNVFTKPPSDDGICDRCGADLVQREDDREDTVRRRISVYHEETHPVVEHFLGLGLPVRQVSGEGSVEEIQKAVRAAVDVGVGPERGPTGAAR